MSGSHSPPMSVFAHHVAHCAMAHQAAVRAARDPAFSQREVSLLTIALIQKLHRLETLVNEMGAGAVFGTPPEAYTPAQVAAMFPAHEVSTPPSTPPE